MCSLRVHKVFLLVLGALECLCFGGWIFGWASLVFVFKQEGYFADTCPVGSTTDLTGVTTTVPSNDSTNSTSSSSEPPPGCDEQDAVLQLVFTVTNFCVSGAALPLGLLYDKMGTLFMRVVISVFMLAGSLMFALSAMSPILHVLVFPAAVCVSTGGVQLLVVNLQISNLFGRNKWIVMALFCGCFDSSAWVFLVVKVLYETTSIPVQTSFFLLTGTTLVFAVNTFFLLPKRASIPWPLPADYNPGPRKRMNITDEPMHLFMNTSGKYTPKRRENDNQETVQNEREEDDTSDQECPNNLHTNGFTPKSLSNGTDAAADTDSNNVSPSDHQTNPLAKDFPSCRSCVLSPIFFLFYIWFSILQLIVLFFVGTLNPVLTRLANNDEQIVSAYTNALAFIQLGGILCAPLSGLLLSRNKRRTHWCKDKDKEEDRLRQRGPYSDMRDAALVYAVSVTICIVFCVFSIVPVLEVQYATFVLSVFGRSFLYSLTASGTSLFFPMQYFGTLYGMMIVLSAVFSLLQYPLFIITQKFLDNNDFWVKIGLLSASILTYSLPIYIFFYARRKEKSFQQKEENLSATQGVESRGISI